MEHNRSRTLLMSAVVLTLSPAVIAALACATNPVTGGREFTLMSAAQEVRVGQELDVGVRREMGVYEDEALQRYVEAIGLTLAADSHRPNLPWHFTIVDVPAINAFALPGGFIYLTRGILPYLDDEAELAGVLGHEIGHVTARHAVQAYTRATSAQLGLVLGGIFAPATRPFGRLAEAGLGVLFLRYGREDELQADRLGAEYAAGSGWDPAGVPGLLTTLARIEELSDRRGIPNWLATHPHPADRVDRIRETVGLLKAKSNAPFLIREADYLRRIDGMVYGDNPEQGIVQGRSFLHPNLRFAVEFPQGWEVLNSQIQVVARQPGADAYMILQIVEQRRGLNLEEVAVRHMRNAGYRLNEGELATINELSAYLGTYRGNVREVGAATALVAHIAYDDAIFALGGIAQRETYPDVRSDFSTSVRTFRPLTASEAAEIRPNRLALYVVRPGDTWEAIAERAGQGNAKPSTLTIMNGYAIHEPPRRGDQIKIVMAG